MLQPKRTKFRKQMKGRNRGLAQSGNKVSFGEFALKATTRGQLTARQIEAARRAIGWPLPLVALALWPLPLSTHRKSEGINNPTSRKRQAVTESARIRGAPGRVTYPTSASLRRCIHTIQGFPSKEPTDHLGCPT